jgi:hypothetical protein
MICRNPDCRKRIDGTTSWCRIERGALVAGQRAERDLDYCDERCLAACHGGNPT